MSTLGFLELEKISPQSLKRESDRELLSLHLRLHQLWGQAERGAKINRELLLNSHLFVREEMGRRGFSHFDRNGLDEAERKLLKRPLENSEAVRGTLPIYPSGSSRNGGLLSLGHVVDCLSRPFMVQENAVSLVGGVAVRGFSKDDADLLIRLPAREELLRRIVFRLERAFPPQERESLQILEDEGPFTDFLPLYDLWLLPRPENEIVLMGEGEEDIDAFAEGSPRRGPWGSAGGKRWLAPVIVPLIPPHETYVEPFCGGAAVFFYRDKPPKHEVLNDKDAETAAAYRFLKSATEKDVKALLELPWRNSKTFFEEIKAQKPESLGRLRRFHRFFVLKHFSFGTRGLNFGYRPDKIVDQVKAWVERRLLRYTERLKKVTILSEDYKSVLDRYDGNGTFFYLDPPYERDLDPVLLKGSFDHDEFARVVKKLAGKCIVSLDNTPQNRERLKGLVVRKVRTKSEGGQNRHRIHPIRTEILAANFDIRPRNKFEESFERIAFLEVPIPKAASAEQASQARRSAREDRIEPFSFFVMPKPTMGAFPNQPFSIASFLSVFEPDDFPVYSSKKFDGGRHQIHKRGSEVQILSEDGEDHTHRLPRTVAAIQDLKPRSLVLDAEIEMWLGGQHQPRERTNGFLKAEGKGDDADIVTNVFDILYFDGKDIHSRPLSERLEVLSRIGIVQSTQGVPKTGGSLNRVPHMLSRSREELARLTALIRALPGSEGNIAKKASSKYHLFGTTFDDWVKFRNTAVVSARVLAAIETKVPGTFNLLLGLPFDPEKFKAAPKWTRRLGEREYAVTGKSFSTEKVKADPGDVVSVEFSPLKHYVFPDGTERVSLILPRVLERVTAPPDSVSHAIREAREGFTYQKIDKESRFEAEESESPESPFGEEPLRGLILKEPYGTLIRQGKKKAIVKTVRFDLHDETFILIEGDWALGRIRLGEPEEISLKEFKRREHLHLIPAESDFYQGRKELYFYRILEWTPFKEPRKIRRPQGPQVILEKVAYA